MEQNKETIQEQPKKKLTLKKVLKVAVLAGLGVVGTLFTVNYKGCRTKVVDAVKGINFSKKQTTTVPDDLPKVEPNQAREYRKDYNNYRQNGYRNENRRPQWNNN